jgi:hypothetical protein
MRTTLTLDDDVAAQIEKLRRERKTTLRDVVNDGLRQGLRLMSEPRRVSKPFATKEVSLGNCLLPTIDDVTEALAVTEGEGFR